MPKHITTKTDFVLMIQDHDAVALVVVLIAVAACWVVAERFTR